MAGTVVVAQVGGWALTTAQRAGAAGAGNRAGLRRRTGGSGSGPPTAGRRSWKRALANMNIGVAHSEVNPNTRVMSRRGLWLTYALGVGLLCIILLSIPFFIKGTPFETPDQGKARLLTHWEQLDYGVQFTSSRKFFTISPIILKYFLASFYTKYDPTHFILNAASLQSVLIPKMPQLHGDRIFGINKY
ncbi:unnamed protein product [Nyctereutes procyonoides]|uniref:(raccoon dog) hypothetical protein n=1 Tax=Nyctereutes procyonoides TaxID=34880 RepID=A0A811YAM9_NYCPR|nr:unnamed protein product [Nyctereutes procyonoides]